MGFLRRRKKPSPGIDRLDEVERDQRRQDRQARRRARRERLAKLLGHFVGTMFNFKSIGLVLTIATIAVAGIIIWRML